MSDDIVFSLRLNALEESVHSLSNFVVVKCGILIDAADEIERLRRELNKATLRGNGHAQRAIDTADEVMRLRAEIARLEGLA